jgi:hypothetical protein
MKATELRIGNYIQINGDLSYATASLIIAIDELELTVKPIPLTEEWLKDFGFIDKYKSCNTDWSIYGFTINQQSDEDDEGSKIPQEQIFYYQYQYDIKYVHQLQNLYFALTGKELTIKQEKHEIKNN